MRFAACLSPICRTGTGRRPWGGRRVLHRILRFAAFWGLCGSTNRGFVEANRWWAQSTLPEAGDW